MLGMMDTAFAQFRKTSGLTLDGVAELFRVNRTTILRWERGSTPIPLKRLAEIEAATGISRTALRPDIFGPSDSSHDVDRVATAGPDGGPSESGPAFSREAAE